MPSRATNRRVKRNFSFGTTQYSAALGSTYSSEKERKQRIAQKKRDAMAYRKEQLADKKMRLQELAADAKLKAAEKKIAAVEKVADRKIETAEKKLETAEKKVEKGALTEAGFEAIKARMEREIEAQERFKAAAIAKHSNPIGNPAFGFGIYTPGFMGENQVAHFSSKAAAETYARSSGLRGYKIKRAFKKNPCASTRKETVSDRAKRYRANQPGCKPGGKKQCKICRSKRFLTVDHVDGNESNGQKSNLRWLCKSCNTRLGAEMARSGEGRRTEQYNPGSVRNLTPEGGAANIKEYVMAGEQHTRHAHDAAGKIIHATPKSKRREWAGQIWDSRRAKGTARWGSASAGHDEPPDWVTNPSPINYRGATIVSLGDMKGYSVSIPARIARDRRAKTFEVHALPEAKERIDAEFGSKNPEESTEYRLGYNIGQADRQTASLRKTSGELHASFAANFPNSANWQAFEQAYQAGYGGQIGAAAPNPGGSGYRPSARAASLRNPEPAQDDGSEEYKQASRTAALFHGRPVKEEISVTESIKEHDWYVSIGPLIKLKIRTLTKRNATLPFARTGEGKVELFCSPDGRQFYLRGGDQELDLEPLGMGEGTEWYRDLMLIGEAKEITYQDQKKFHKFKIVDYFHKLGEVTKKKPMLMYDSLAKKLQIVGGQYKVEMEDLVEDMSPGIVN
jgi:hypothetical protein